MDESPKDRWKRLRKAFVNEDWSSRSKFVPGTGVDPTSYKKILFDRIVDEIMFKLSSRSMKMGLSDEFFRDPTELLKECIFEYLKEVGAVDDSGFGRQFCTSFNEDFDLKPGHINESIVHSCAFGTYIYALMLYRSRDSSREPKGYFLDSVSTIIERIENRLVEKIKLTEDVPPLDDVVDEMLRNLPKIMSKHSQRSVSSDHPVVESLTGKRGRSGSS